MASADIDLSLTAHARPVAVRRYVGAEGLSLLGRSTRWFAADPSAFRADDLRLSIDHMTIQAFTATPHRCERSADAVTSPADDAICLTYLAGGSIRSHRDEGEFDIVTGDLSVARLSSPFRYDADEPIRVIRSIVTLDHFPRHLLTPERLPAGPLHRSVLVQSFIAFIRQVVSSPQVGTDEEMEHLASAVVDLEIAILAEAVGASERTAGMYGRRERIRDYIDAHLHDPQLAPQSIADALGMSVRYVHRSFNTEETTVSRYVRDRRLDAIAVALRNEARNHRLGELSTRFGFSGPDQMTRAFKQRFGMTVGAYQDANGPTRS